MMGYTIPSRTLRRLGAGAALVLLLAPGLARAADVQVEEHQALERWRVQDKCVTDSVTANPNRDIESQRKRDKFVDTCMTKHGLPPRAHLVRDDKPAGDKTATDDKPPADAPVIEKPGDTVAGPTDTVAKPN
jgi:hypothetical protein